MDTRTVISCIPFSLREFTYKELTHIKSQFRNESFFNSMFFGDSGVQINKIYQYLNEIKMLDKSYTRIQPLSTLKSWRWNDYEISSDRGEFKIVFCDIEIDGREVKRWQQPLLEATEESVFGLLYCIKSNKMQFLVHANSEIGCFDKIELGPSVQLGTYDKSCDCIVSLFKNNIESNKGVEFKGMFSEEGGRFYHEQNCNVIMQIHEDDLPEQLPEGYFWADFQTLNILIQFNNCLNIQLRNLLSILNL